MPRIILIATLGHIKLQARWSAVFAFFFLVWLLGAVYLPNLLPAESRITWWSVAFLAVLLFYASTTAHEVGHCIAARARSLPVGTITLRTFGGSSDIQEESETAADEMLVSLAGPAASALVSGFALVLRLSLPDPSAPLVLLLEGLFLLNFWLGVFNLIPILPLDGGRALRGLLWHIQGDYLSATARTATFGRVLAGGLVVGAAALFLTSLNAEAETTPLGGWFGADPRSLALVLLIAAWLFNRGARNAHREALLRHRLTATTVGSAMAHEPRTVPVGTALDVVAIFYPRRQADPAVAVIGGNNELLGLVSYSDLEVVLPAEQRFRRVEQIMTPAQGLVTVGPDDPLQLAVRHMAEGHLNQLPVVVEGRLVGMISRSQVLDLMDLL